MLADPMAEAENVPLPATVLMIPSDFVTLSKSLSEYLQELAAAQTKK